MRRITTLALLLATAVTASPSAAVPITADATLELTFTLTGVTITDTLTSNSFPAVFETSEEVGDLIFEDVGPNGSTSTGESSNNPPGSVGSASASETVLLSGLDVFVDDYDQDSFGIGDSLVATLQASASAETPDSVFFGQVDSENTLYFMPFGNPTDQFTFSFDYSASLTGTLDSTALAGTTLAFVDDEEVSGEAEDFNTGDPKSFLVLSDFFNVGSSNSSTSVVSVNEMASGSFDVAFDPGDSAMSITFASSLVVNARVDPVAQPLDGDFNADGVVDAADYTVWRDNTSGEFEPGDYDTWSQNYGATPPPAVAVPEPGALLLAAMALAASPRRRSFR